ncbi:hypothetical protein DL96DRAFT_1817175 [Flagelloscypha sp. PMI_526]|nr:hypothetical protein DL96DRAFT_1817175 [Flagelloscypha sp. PMI_526]
MTTPFLPCDILSIIPLYTDWTRGDKPGASKDAQLACCLASRVFVHAARQHLFHTLYLNGRRHRERALANLPQLTGYVKSIWLVVGFENSELDSAAAIFKNVPNITELRVCHRFPREEILAHDLAREAFMEYLSPLIHELSLTSVPQFGTYFLSAFKNITFLSINCILQQDEPLVAPETTSSSMTSQVFLDLACEGAQDVSLTTLARIFECGNVQLRKLYWYSPETPDDTASQRYPPSCAFKSFFVGQSQTIVDLHISTCRPCEVNLDNIPPNQHPWSPQNLPRLETLRLPSVTTTWFTIPDERKEVKENITWIAKIFRSLTYPHPLRTFHILFDAEDMESFPESTPWHELDDALQSQNLHHLEKVIMSWDRGAEGDEQNRQEFAKERLSRSYERGIISSIGTPDNNLATLTQTFEYQGVQLRKFRWFSVETADDTWSQGHPPGVAFTKFFARQSQNIVNLEVSLCRPDEVNMDFVPPDRHPWAPQSLPRLEILRPPSFTTTIQREYYMDCYNPAKPHIRSSFEKLAHSTRRREYDNVLQSENLQCLEKVFMAWDREANADEQDRQRFVKEHLPVSYARAVWSI